MHGRGAAGPGRASGPEQVPSQESPTLIGFGPSGEACYEGTATHLGRVRAAECFHPNLDPDAPDSVFATHVKTAASGDRVTGTLVPDGPADPFAAGAITIDGGTGRFPGATGLS